MTIPIDPAVTGGAVRGRRDPRLIRDAPPAATVGAVTAQPPVPGLTVDPSGDVAIDQRGVPGMDPEPILVFPGDVIAASTTIAIDFGTGGTSFVRYEHRTIVQDGEEEIDVYARVATTTNNGVINLANDIDDRLQEREREQTELAARAGIPAN